MRGERRIEDVGGGQSFTIVCRCRDGRQGAPVEDAFNLDEDSIEGFDVDIVAEGKSRKMFLKKSDDSFPAPSTMRRSCRNEFPFDALTL